MGGGGGIAIAFACFDMNGFGLQHPTKCAILAHLNRSLPERGHRMPTMRKLTPDEIGTLEGRARGPRKQAEEQYDRIIFEFDAGDYGEVELEPEEKRLTVRNRLKAAAQRRGLALDFIRTSGNMLRFHVREPSAGA
jgi:hypothetical protein